MKVLFVDKALRKKFWHRKSKDARPGLVDEPVQIHGRHEQDPTLGLSDLKVEAHNHNMELKAGQPCGAVTDPKP